VQLLMTHLVNKKKTATEKAFYYFKIHPIQSNYKLELISIGQNLTIFLCQFSLIN